MTKSNVSRTSSDKLPIPSVLSDEISMAVFTSNMLLVAAHMAPGDKDGSVVDSIDKCLNAIKERKSEWREDYQTAKDTIMKNLKQKQKQKRLPSVEIKNSQFPNDKRDQFIYAQRKQGIPFAQICNAINKRNPDECVDEKTAGEALRRYCKRLNIPFPYGKRGRKSDS